MPKSPTVVHFGDKYAVDDSPVPFTEVHDIFGETFKVVHDVNLFQYMAIADDEPKLSDLHRMIISCIAEEDQPRFKSVIGRQRNLKIDTLMALFKDLLEVASEERPTSSSSGSSRTTRTKAVGRGSAAS